MVDSFKNNTIWNGMLLIHNLSNEMHKSLCASIAPCSVHGIMLLACGNVHWLNDILSCAGKHILQRYAMRTMTSAMKKKMFCYRAELWLLGLSCCFSPLLIELKKKIIQMYFQFT